MNGHWPTWHPARPHSTPASQKLAHQDPGFFKSVFFQWQAILSFEINLVVVKQPFIRNEGEQVEKNTSFFAQNKSIYCIVKLDF